MLMMICQASTGMGLMDAVSAAISLARRNQCGVRMAWEDKVIVIRLGDTTVSVHDRYTDIFVANVAELVLFHCDGGSGLCSAIVR